MMQHVFPLTCAHCGQPWAHIQNGCLILESRHGGHSHSNAIALASLQLLLAMSTRQEIAPLRCHHDDCSRPWGLVQGGKLFCYVRHNGEAHQNTLSLTTVATLLGAVITPCNL